MKEKKDQLIIGRQPIIEAMKAGRQLERIYLLKSGSGDTFSQIRELAKQQNVPVNYVPVEKLNSLSRHNHQGCIAIAGSVKYYDLQEVISFVIEKGETPLFLLLDAVTDVRNIGAIARSALCCGAQAIIIPDRGVAPLNEAAIKASAGALHQLYVCRVPSLLKAIDELHLNGINILASEMKAGKHVYECEFTEPVAIIMGAEDKGIYPPLLKAADEKFNIPMAGNFDSLNVSVAAGIILYEAMKQRMPAT